MKELMEMLKNKKKAKKTPNMDSKMEVLQELQDMLSGVMGEDLAELKKVTVAAKDKKGLKAGLEKAEEMLGSESEEDMDEEDEYC